MKKFLVIGVLCTISLVGCSQSADIAKAGMRMSNIAKEEAGIEDYLVDNPKMIVDDEYMLEFNATYVESYFLKNYDIYSLDSESIQAWVNKGTINNAAMLDSGGVVRGISIVTPEVLTFKDIQVGDSVNRVLETFEFEQQLGNGYQVLCMDNKEVDRRLVRLEDTPVSITYIIDGETIVQIDISDSKYQQVLR